MSTDNLNSGVPMETPSNAPVDIDGYFIEEGAETDFTSTQANLLNQAGIRTVAFHGGRWALWGAHTAAYAGDDGMEPRDVYDVNLRMLYYLANWFQVQFGAEVDRPISRNRMDAIVNETRAFMDGLRAMGALLYADVEFNETESVGDLVRGEFRFDSAVTPTPPVRAVVLSVAYTDAGLSLL